MNGAPKPNNLPIPTAADIERLGDRVDRRIDADPSKLDREIEQSIAKSIAIIAMLRFGVENGSISQEELDAQTAAESNRVQAWIHVETEISVEALRRKVERDGTVSTPLA